MKDPDNPYRSPVESEEIAARSATQTWHWSRTRICAAGLFAVPFVIAAPIRYWAFHHAGSWFVSTEIDPDQRAMFLGLSAFVLTASISVCAVFLAFVLLWFDRCFRPWTGIAAIVLGLLAIPALAILAITVQSYVEFS